MSAAHGTVYFTWGDEEECAFRLGLKEVRELQDNPRIAIGPLALFNRIRKDDWKVDDLREVIRIGLIGAGRKPEEALAKVRRYFDDFPKSDQKEPAMKILAGFLIGDPVEPVGKPSAAKDVKEETASASPLPQSTDLEQ